jgi:quercetin dioxygenase-like cupin family protein
VGDGGVADRLRDEGLRPSAWGNAPGERYASHRHPYDKVIVVERGSIAFALPEASATIDLAAGDRLELPAGTEHEATVGDDGVSCLEAHLPPGALSARDPRRIEAGTW